MGNAVLSWTLKQTLHFQLQKHHLKNVIYAGQWRHMSLIPAVERKRQLDLCEYETSLVYRVSSRPARAVAQRRPILQNLEKKNVTRGVLITFVLGIILITNFSAKVLTQFICRDGSHGCVHMCTWVWTSACRCCERPVGVCYIAQWLSIFLFLHFHWPEAEVMFPFVRFIHFYFMDVCVHVRLYTMCM